MKFSLACAYSSVLYADFDRSLGLYTKGPSLDELIEQITRAHQLGYKGVELETLTRTQLQDVFTRKSVSRLNEVCGSLGLEVSGFYAQFIHHVNETTQAFKDFESICQVTSELDAKSVTVLSPVLDGVEAISFGHKGGAAEEIRIKSPRASWKEQWEKYVSVVSGYADIASSAQLKVAVEPRPYDIVNNTERFLLLLQETKSKNIGILFDTAHFFVQREVLEVSIEKLGHNLLALHFGDNDGQADYHLAPGKGKINWASVLSALRAVGYDGYANVEIGDSDNLIEEYKNAREYLERLVTRAN